MRIHVLPFDQLTAAQLDVWSCVQRGDPSFCSPFFRPEFTQLIASVRDDVEVGIMEANGQSIGFFPFQRDQRNVARPVGLGLSDYQGVVVDSNVRWTAEDLLRGCRLRAWHFDHVLATQKPFERHHWLAAESAYADLSQGFAWYQKQLSKAKEVKASYRKSRKIEREVGPLRLVPHAFVEGVFRRLLDWKIRQYARLGAVHHLAAEWKLEVLRKVATTQLESFAGMLSALYAGDHLIAVHLGMKSDGTFHNWFPAYDPAFAKYSPGLIFWLRFIEDAVAFGIRRVDFGKGDERYKRVLGSGVTAVAEGSVDSRWLVPAFRRRWLRARELVRASPLRAPVQRVVRGLRRRVGYRDVASNLENEGRR